MEPKKTIINGDQEQVTESANEQEIENKNISEAIISSQPRIPDVIGLNTDASFVNRVNDAQEIENE